MMSRRRVSIEDIARAAGVSHSTVSRALRDNPLISADVRGTIQRLAREMGYTPNAIAQSLQMQRTNTVGLVVTTVGDPFLADVVRGVEEVARPLGMSVLLSASHNDPAEELDVIDQFHRRRVDGLLLLSSRLDGPQLAQVADMRVPTVLINSQAAGSPAPLHAVAVDDDAGARLAVGHLLGLGHRAIGYLGVADRPASDARRRAAYRAMLLAAGVTPRDTWAATAHGPAQLALDDVEAARGLLGPLLDAGVTALFCFNDMLALGALLACRERGVAVPERLSVVGFDDIQLAQYLAPALTTVRQPRARLGELAMRMVADLLAGAPVQNHTVAPELVVRGSTAPPLRGAAVSQ